MIQQDSRKSPVLSVQASVSLALAPALETMSSPAVGCIVALSAAEDGVAGLAHLLLAIVVIVQDAVGAVSTVTNRLETGDGV